MCLRVSRCSSRLRLLNDVALYDLCEYENCFVDPSKVFSEPLSLASVMLNTPTIGIPAAKALAERGESGEGRRGRNGAA
jgi:hypothetical protein